MRRILSAGVMLLALAGAARAQTPGNAPKFDAADISLRAHTGTTSQPVEFGKLSEEATVSPSAR